MARKENLPTAGETIQRRVAAAERTKPDLNEILRRKDAFLVCNPTSKTVELRYGGSQLEVLCYFESGEHDELFEMLRYLLTSYTTADSHNLLAALDRIREKNPRKDTKNPLTLHEVLIHLDHVLQQSAAAQVLTLSVNSYFSKITASCVSRLPVEFIYHSNVPTGTGKNIRLAADSIVVAGEAQLIESGSPTSALLPGLEIEEAEIICRLVNHLANQNRTYLAALKESQTDDSVVIPDAVMTAPELSQLLGVEMTATGLISLIRVYRKYATPVAIELVDYYMYESQTYFRINPQYTPLSFQQQWKRGAEPNSTALTPDQAK
jgi:hypothetical protein